MGVVGEKRHCCVLINVVILDKIHYWFIHIVIVWFCGTVQPTGPPKNDLQYVT